MRSASAGACRAIAYMRRICAALLAAAMVIALLPVWSTLPAVANEKYTAHADPTPGPQISVTAPFWITFGSEDSPYDVANPSDSITTSSYFKNSGSEGISLYAVECLLPSNAGADLSGLVLEDTNGTALTDESQKIFTMWEESAGEEDSLSFGYYNSGQNAVSAETGTLGVKMGVDEGGTLNCMYRLNLSNDSSLANAAVKKQAAKPADAQERQSLGTFKFTFTAWYPPLGFGELTGMSDAELSALPFFFKDVRQSRPERQEVYSLAQIKEMSAKLTESGRQGTLYSEFQEFIEDPSGYECKVMYGDTGAKQQYPVNLIGVLQDQGRSGKSIGFTFQFKDVLETSALSSKLPASAASCNWISSSGGASMRTKLNTGGEYYSKLDIASDLVEVRKQSGTNPQSSKDTTVTNSYEKMFLASRYELGGQYALRDTYYASDGSTQSIDFAAGRPWIAKEGTGPGANEQYQLFAAHGSGASAASGSDALLGKGVAWWTRSSWPAGTQDFSQVDERGAVAGAHAPVTQSAGIVPCFCL